MHNCREFKTKGTVYLQSNFFNIPSMLTLSVLKETKLKENRVALTPDVAKDLIKQGFNIIIESGAGNNSFYTDESYTALGVKVSNATDTLIQADILLAVNPPLIENINQLKPGASVISFMWAAINEAYVNACVAAKVNAFSMDAIPRISRAQKMDALSSQANLAGYKAVLIAADTIGKMIPMMTTAAGVIKPCKVVIFGAGVAGLQAIATAKRLGAIVEVSDIRPETKEQIQSLGGKFIEVKSDTSVVMEGGYVKGVSAEFLKAQQELVFKHVKEADIVITTALIPGKKAPVLVTSAMVESMKFGSVIVDMAVEQGGNVEGSVLNDTVTKNGVKIVGEGNLPSLLPMNASALYAKNIATLLLHLATKDSFKWELEEEITKGCLIVHNGIKK